MNKFIIARLSVVILLVISTGCRDKTSPPQATIRNDKTVLNPRFRIDPKPSEGESLRTNPPVFLVPLVGEKKTFTGGIPEIGDPVYYSFRLSQDKSFPADATMHLDDSPWAIFNPHKKLAPGTWYWQYKSNKTDWSPVLSFRINEDTPVFETPTYDELLAGIPAGHPRVLAPDGNLENLRQRNQGGEDARQIIKRADQMLSVEPPEEKLGVPTKKGTTEVQNNKLALDASKYLGSLARQGLDPLAKAYVLTGEEKYARAAIRWALKVASYDPNGVSMKNNFGDSECMYQMAYVYDACFDLLSEDEKEQLRAGIVPRADHFYQRWRNMLEAKVFSGHIWQHILERLFKTSVALLDEVPEAGTWLNFIYEVYLARSPVLGPSDGGWWNGNHYVELNGITLMDLPMFFQSWTGVDIIRSPFYENIPFWLIYSFPANSYSEGFGNGTEKQFGQKLGVLGFMDALTRITGNPYAAWYADFQLKNGVIGEGWNPFYFGYTQPKTGHTIHDDDEFRWFRIAWELRDPPAPATDIADLPLARVFPETGSANMHTDLQHAENNLMVSMRSSPFGSTSHAHANQNAFNIQYGGEKLFYNSGYRPSMGVPHYVKWFKATIGHNTVLIDGKGQPIGAGESYGWIPRFLHGEAISYALGDASMAYDNQFREPQKAGIKLFRRHLIFLRPSIIVVYDELEADHDAEWTWLVHSPFEISLDDASQHFSVISTTAKSRVDQFGSSDLVIELSTKFDPEPVNFRDIKGPDGKILEYRDQWHIYSRPGQKSEKFRYLSIFQLKPAGDPSRFVELEIENGMVKLAGWEINAELDTERQASLLIIHPEERKGLIYNEPELLLGNQSFRPDINGSTMLVEILEKKNIIEEAIDVFPRGRD